MNNFNSISLVFSLSLALLSAASLADSANASELFHPRNSHITQSALAPGSRLFIAVDDETGIVANERYVNTPDRREVRFATTDRQAIARWLASVERGSSEPPAHGAPWAVKASKLIR